MAIKTHKARQAPPRGYRLRAPTHAHFAGERRPWGRAIHVIESRLRVLNQHWYALQIAERNSSAYDQVINVFPDATSVP